MACWSGPCYTDGSNKTYRNTIAGFDIEYSGSCSGYSGGAYFKNTFVDDCDSCISNLNYYSSTYGSLTIDWIGHVGTYRSTGCTWHRHYRGWDISRIQWTNGTSLDICNGAHNGNLTTRRRYLAVDAILRKYFADVYDGYTNSAHATHFHIDDGCGMGPLNTSRSSHTKFIQKVCNDFNGTSLVVDGIWGSNTEAAYQSLLGVLCMKCIDPKTSTGAYQTFLSYIAKHGFKNKSAGYYKYGCTPCAS